MAGPPILNGKPHGPMVSDFDFPFNHPNESDRMALKYIEMAMTSTSAPQMIWCFIRNCPKNLGSFFRSASKNSSSSDKIVESSAPCERPVMLFLGFLDQWAIQQAAPFQDPEIETQQVREHTYIPYIPKTGLETCSRVRHGFAGLANFSTALQSSCQLHPSWTSDRQKLERKHVIIIRRYI